MILSSLILLGLAFVATASSHSSIQYETITGFFAQDLPETDPSTFDYIASNFGLLNTFNRLSVYGQPQDSTEPPWNKFKSAIKSLNNRAARNTRYVVMFLARHGQGYHNVAEAYYGTELWDCYWSLLDGNGTISWADATTTDIGLQEAQKANAAWKKQLKSGAPQPESYYTSPLRRAATTLQITWSDITLKKGNPPHPIIKEGLRETIGIHTCDRRSSKSQLQQTYPNFHFAHPFPETDMLWQADLRESNDQRDIRLKRALDDIVRSDGNTYITISAHGGVIESILKVLGHRKWGLRTGAMVSVVVKVEFVSPGSPTATEAQPSGTVPPCPALK